MPPCLGMPHGRPKSTPRVVLLELLFGEPTAKNKFDNNAISDGFLCNDACRGSATKRFCAWMDGSVDVERRVA